MRPAIDSKWIATVLFLSAVLLGCGYLRPGKKASSNTNGNQSKRSQPTTAFNSSGDARQNIRAAYLKLKTSYPYRLTETTTMTGGKAPEQPVTRVVEFAAADRIHAKMSGIETITFGDKHYSNYGGKWVETGEKPKGSEGNMEKLMASFVKDVQPAGAETVNGVPCFSYTIRYEGDWSGQPATGTGKVWIGLADGRVHQNDGELKIASYITKSHLAYEYNVDLKVEKPVP